ncbi:XRE family transcriptional regulator [Vibrio sp. F74]|uniref:XRE family transcriptional regulator n=1 Tax=Vibrio sp. F74 TaxID=700020 RepID=UPI0035F5C0D1
MDFTQEDREELYHVWMSKKANMRLIQMEVVKKLGISQMEFSALLRGGAPLTYSFVKQFCQIMHIEPQQAISSLRNGSSAKNKTAFLKTRLSVDGEIQRAYVEGNEVIVEYIHRME